MAVRGFDTPESDCPIQNFVMTPLLVCASLRQMELPKLRLRLGRSLVS